jgi:diguanylate cyclase (GGDEF)-like protein
VGHKAYSFVLCDLDHFKRLNDRFGHEIGDAALRLFADVLRRVVRDGDVVARWGGEEFALILPDMAAAKAAEIVERAQTALREALAGGSVPAFTSSFGIGDSSMSRSFRDMARLADAALYESKDAGRDRWTIADPQRQREAKDRHATEYLAAIDVGMVETGQYEMVELRTPPTFSADDADAGGAEPARADKRHA